MHLSSDLFKRLINHRVSDERARREDYLTEVLAWMLENDLKLRALILAADGPLYGGADAGHAPQPGEDLQITTQDTESVDYGRPDLCLRKTDDPDWCLIVESKVDAPFDPAQITTYAQGMNKHRNSRLVALIPRAQAVLHSAELQLEGFLGVRAWEDIAQVIGQTRDEADETTASLRGAFITLLDSLGLVDRPPINVAWQAQATVEEKQQVLELCTCLDRVTAELAGQPQDLGARLNPWYGPQAGRLQLGHYGGQHPVRSNAGPTPRPALYYRTALRSRADGIGDLWFDVAFRPYSGDTGAPAVSVALWAGTKVDGQWIQDPAMALRQLVRFVGGPAEHIADLEQRAPALLARFRERLAQVLGNMRDRLATSAIFPGLSSTVECDAGGCRLRLCDTEAFLGPEVHTGRAQERYRQGLTAVLQAFFDSSPEVPMAMLLAEACCPDWE